jgi:predicted metal-dependent HD superfamily phosphohydrolase
MLADRWEALWARTHLTIPEEARAEGMVARYEEPQRSYHTLQHLRECLTWLDATRSLAHDPDVLELAMWYHDAVYEPRRSDNEQASADLARDHLLKGGAGTGAAAIITSLILWTAHAAVPPEGDPALLVDIDLAILGAPAPRYAEYERQIREEYTWVPMFLFRKRRAALLEGFVQRRHIYATSRLRDELESQARVNLAAAIAALRGG